MLNHRKWTSKWHLFNSRAFSYYARNNPNFDAGPSLHFGMPFSQYITYQGPQYLILKRKGVGLCCVKEFLAQFMLYTSNTSIAIARRCPLHKDMI